MIITYRTRYTCGPDGRDDMRQFQTRTHRLDWPVQGTILIWVSWSVYRPSELDLWLTYLKMAF